MKNKAFTLSEVLITLGVIGVVAAMTLPTVINKVERNILKQQFKKVLSVYSQNILKTTYDLGGSMNCYYGQDENGQISSTTGIDYSGCKTFYEHFAKNLKVIKKCEGNALVDGCLPVYSEYRSESGCSGYSEQAFNVTNTVYVLADGTLLMPYANQTLAAAAVDINGKKGPNKPGYDLFNFSIMKTHKNSYIINAHSINGCLPYLEGRLTYDEMFK